MLPDSSLEITTYNGFNYPCDVVISRRTGSAAEPMLLLRYHFPAAFQRGASNFIPGEARKGGYYVHHHQQPGPSHPCHGELQPASTSTTQNAVNEELPNPASLLQLALSHAQLWSEQGAAGVWLGWETARFTYGAL